MKKKVIGASMAALLLTATLSVPVLAAGNVSPARENPVPRVPTVREIPGSLEVEIFDESVPMAPGPQTGYED